MWIVTSSRLPKNVLSTLHKLIYLYNVMQVPRSRQTSADQRRDHLRPNSHLSSASPGYSGSTRSGFSSASSGYGSTWSGLSSASSGYGSTWSGLSSASSRYGSTWSGLVRSSAYSRELIPEEQDPMSSLGFSPRPVSTHPTSSSEHVNKPQATPATVVTGDDSDGDEGVGV